MCPCGRNWICPSTIHNYRYYCLPTPTIGGHSTFEGRCIRGILTEGFRLGAKEYNFLIEFSHDEQGQDLIEYTLLTAFPALSSCALFLGAGGSIKGIWVVSNNQLAQANAMASQSIGNKAAIAIRFNFPGVSAIRMAYRPSFPAVSLNKLPSLMRRPAFQAKSLNSSKQATAPRHDVESRKPF
jgi:Flp pilus assembly pilin Flp